MTVVSGTTAAGIRYEYRPRSGAPTLALVMGYAGGMASWGETFLAHLTPHAGVFLLDNCGTGASAKPREPARYATSELARDLIEALDAAGIARCHLVGYSLGGCIALDAALLATERFASLVLLATTAGGALYTSPGEAVLQALAEPQGKDVYEMFESTWRVCMGEGRTAAHKPELDRIYAEQAKALTPRFVMRAQLAAYRGFDAVARLPQVHVPSLVIHGKDDPLTPAANGVALAARLPAARLALLDDTAHSPHVEAPAALTALLMGSTVVNT